MKFKAIYMFVYKTFFIKYFQADYPFQPELFFVKEK